MKRMGFTLLEMIIVVCIIVLLISILLPTLGRARSLARLAVCSNNLRELGHGIQLARLQGGGLPSGHAFPAVEWPGVPSAQDLSQKVFFCPEGPGVPGETTGWMIVSNQEATGYPFLEGADVHVVVGPDPGGGTSADGYTWPATLAGHTQYRIDDGHSRDVDDVVLDRNNTTNWVYKAVAGYYGADGGTIGLTYNGQPYPGWTSIGPLALGAGFFMTGTGTTNYAVNAVTGVQNVVPDTIILLDYTQIQANCSEPMYTNLYQMYKDGRHMGRVNVLYADYSVRASWGLSLNKVDNPSPWTPAQD